MLNLVLRKFRAKRVETEKVKTTEYALLKFLFKNICCIVIAFGTKCQLSAFQVGNRKAQKGGEIKSVEHCITLRNYVRVCQFWPK